MAISWHKRVKGFKSPLRVVAAFLLRSRERLAAHNQRLREEVKSLEIELERQAAQQEQQRREIDRLRREVAQLQQQCEAARQTVQLSRDPPWGTHGFGPRMIALAVNTARLVGLRGAERVLRLFFDWLGVDQPTPSRTSIRNWMQRVGIAELQRPLDDDEAPVIMVDHSNQIGTEKVLVALAVKSSALPEAGKALRHEDMRVLEVRPGSCWKREDMQRQYQELADRYAAPRAVVTDGAAELREGAKCLENRGSGTLVLGDFKHYAANVMKSLMGKQPRFKEVASHIGRTRSAIQQTELAHLTPPSPKAKARFMNLASTIRWMTMILWLLRTPDAKARAGISAQRLQEKLGWVEEYEEDIAVWQECQQVVSRSLKFINEQHLHQGAAEGLRKAIGDGLQHDTSNELARRLIDFVAEAEQGLRPGERLPLSTEILESTFGLYKQLERQHCKSGFTSLLACLPALLRPITAQQVREAFSRVSAKDVKAWVSKNFGTTVAARRNEAYAEHKAALNGATMQVALT